MLGNCVLIFSAAGNLNLLYLCCDDDYRLVSLLPAHCG